MPDRKTLLMLSDCRVLNRYLARPVQYKISVHCRQRNFTMELEGATTEEAIAEERAAAFHAAESKRLQVTSS